jgi:hypothetical protein
MVMVSAESMVMVSAESTVIVMMVMMIMMAMMANASQSQQATVEQSKYVSTLSPAFRHRYQRQSVNYRDEGKDDLKLKS